MDDGRPLRLTIGKPVGLKLVYDEQRIGTEFSFIREKPKVQWTFDEENRETGGRPQKHN